MTDRGKRKLLEVLRHAFLIIIVAVIVLPFVWMLISSFKDNNDVFDNTAIFPRVWRFSNYPEALRAAPFAVFFKNSIIVTAVSVLSQLVTCSLAAFAFAKLRFHFRNLIFQIFLACMMIPSQATVISNYITVSRLGLVNTYTGLVLVSLTSVFGIFLMRQNYKTIPDEYMEAAALDGCGKLRTYLHVFLPMGKSALATAGIFSMVDVWNDYMWPLIVTNSTRYKTVQTGITYMISEDVGSQWGYIMAIATIIVMPVIIVFIILQKYFIQGIASTGIK